MINLIEKARLGDVDQWYVARGRNEELPVLLFLHGGPGSPQTGAQHKFNRELEEHFIVVNWDQRGAGKSYDPSIPKGTMSIEQLMSDAKALIDYLFAKFNKEKVYMMGHSMGALLGMLLVHRHPEVVYAFVGVNQPVDLVEGEKRSYDYVLKTSKEKRHSKALRDLEHINTPKTGTYVKMDDLVIQRKWLTKFGGVTYKKNAMLINLHYLPEFSLYLERTVKLYERFRFYFN